MKPQAFWILIGIGIATVAVSCASRAPASKPKDAGMTAVGKQKPEQTELEFDGTIERIDIDNGTVTVQHWPLSKKFRVPAGCEIDVYTNANATLAQLKVDDPVAVAYSESGADLIAGRIMRRGKAYEQEQREKMERLNDMLYPSPNQ